MRIRPKAAGFQKTTRVLKTSTRLTLLCALVATTTAALARAGDAGGPSYRFDIAGQTLPQALRNYAQISGQEIIFVESLFEGTTKSVSLKGSYTARDALDRLLKGTGLVYERSPSGAIMIQRAGETATRNPTSNSGNFLFASEEREVARGSGQSRDSFRLAQNAQGALNSNSSSQSGAATQNSKSENKGGDNDLEEIVVTAQKREQRLQDVPISISVLRGENLDKTTAESMSEILNRVPGVATTVQNGGTLVAVRGVTAFGALFSGSSPIAYYLDSVPFGLVKTALAPDASAYDMERVEVLRGPQGTLYGATALNGVMRILTKDANVNRFEFKARTSASTTENGGNNYRGDMAVNVPIIEGKLAARAVVGYQDQSGWIDRPPEKDANDARTRNMRLKVNAQPLEELSIGLSAWLSRADYGAPSVGADNGTFRSLLPEPVVNDFDAYNLKVGYDLPWFSIAGMTSYIDYFNNVFLDISPPVGTFADTRLQTQIDADVFAQEININSLAEGSWRWSAGGIYRDAEDSTYQARRNITTGALCCTYVAPSDITFFSESFAVFGEVTRLLLGGRLELTGGLRYFEDDVVSKEASRTTGVSTSQLVNSDSTFDALSPRAVLTWHPSTQATVYLSYAEGFRSGSDQLPVIRSVAPDFPSVDSDTLINYELGTKLSLWEGRVNFDTAVYYIDWQDVQQQLLVQITPGFNNAALINGKSASGMGVDFAVTTRPIDRLELGVNLSWNDLTMDSDVIAGNGVRYFAAGDRLNLSAEYTAGASLDYAFPLSRSGFEARFAASANYISKQLTRSLVGTTLTVASGDSQTIARASFSINAPSHWTATLFADNINNYSGVIVRGTNLDRNTRVRPRTIGAQLEYRF